MIGLSHSHAPQACTGLNIAGFNDGIALGSLLSGASLEVMRLISTARADVLAVELGIAVCCGVPRSSPQGFMGR